MSLDRSLEQEKIGKALLSAIERLIHDPVSEESLQSVLEFILQTSSHIRLAWMEWGEGDPKGSDVLPRTQVASSASTVHLISPLSGQFRAYQRKLSQSALVSNKTSLVRFSDKNCFLEEERQQLIQWELAEALLIPIVTKTPPSRYCLSLYSSRSGFFEETGIEQFRPFAQIMALALNTKLVRTDPESSLPDDSPECFFTMDPRSGQIFPRNQPAQRWFQSFTPEKNPHLNDVFGPEDRKKIQESLNQLTTRPGSSVVLPIETPSFTELSLQGMVDRNGEIIIFGRFRTLAEESERRRNRGGTIHLYEKVLEGLQEGFFELDRERRILEANPTAGQLLGYEYSSLIGLPFESLLYSDEASAPIRKSLLSRTGLSHQNTVLCKRDGTALPVDLILLPTEKSQVKQSGPMIVAFRDRSEKAQEDLQLEEEERVYRQIVQHAPDGIYLFDPDTLSITHSNTALEEMMGFETGEILGQPITRFVEIPVDVIQKRIRSIQTKGPSNNIARHYRKKDGSFIPVSTSASLITLHGQKQILVIIRDMTEEAFMQELSQLEHGIDHQLLNQTPIAKILSGVSDRLLELFHLSLCCFLRQDQNDSFPRILAISGKPVLLADHLRTLLRTEDTFLKATIEAVRTMKHSSETLPHFFVEPFQSILTHPEPLKGHLFCLNPYSHSKQEYLLLMGPDESFSRHLRPLHHLAERIGIAILRYEDMERSRLQQAAMGASLTPMFIANRHGKIEWSNPAFEQLTGYSLADVLEQTSREESLTPKPEYHHRLQQCLKAGIEFSGEVTDQKKDGTVYTTEMRITPIRQGDGTITHYIAVLTDISDRKAREKKLQQWAFYDPLTGLPNRFLLNLLLEKEIARTDRSNRGIAVCFIDLDRFKPINDQFGHEVGDRILESVSDRLESVIRRGDIVGRLGGDEFVCLMPGITSRRTLEKILDRVLTAIETPLTEGGQKLRLGASIGVSLYPEDPAHDPKELIHHADLAMYQAKKEGGSRYIFFTDLSSPSNVIPAVQPY